MADTRVDRQCAYCDSTFRPRLADVNRGKARYCSVQCRHLALLKDCERASAKVRWSDIDGIPCALVRLASSPQHEITLDHSDLDWFLDYAGGWAIARCAGCVYVQSTRGFLRLHKILCQCEAPLITDHRNGDTLDCRRSNLRPATRRQNAHNSRRENKVGFKGVWKSGRKFTGAIKGPDGIRRSIGFYDTPEDAARAHDALALRWRGEFAYLNLPDQRMSPEEIAASPALTRWICAP